MVTTGGTARVGLRVEASEAYGTIDYTLTFPNGAIAKASSRLIPHGRTSIYTFVLEAPPLPLEELEGALAEQSRILADELVTLTQRLRNREQLHLS
jgi:hypothetical protein